MTEEQRFMTKVSSKSLLASLPPPSPFLGSEPRYLNLPVHIAACTVRVSPPLYRISISLYGRLWEVVEDE